MKLLSRLSAVAAIALTGTLVSCSTGPGYTYQNVQITLTPPTPYLFVPAFATFAQYATQEFTANVTNAPANVTFTLYPQVNYLPISGAASTTGVVTPLTGTLFNQAGPFIYYSTPNTPPVYTGAAAVQAAALGIPNGSVLLVATVPNDPNNPSSVARASILIPIVNSIGPIPAGCSATTVPACSTSPNTSVGLSPLTGTIARNTTLQFTGYSIGSPDNTVVYQVNGVVGGSTAFGTITPGGLYTAPAAIPITNPIQVTVISHAQSSVMATANITIN